MQRYNQTFQQYRPYKQILILPLKYSLLTRRGIPCRYKMLLCRFWACPTFLALLPRHPLTVPDLYCRHILLRAGMLFCRIVRTQWPTTAQSSSTRRMWERRWTRLHKRPIQPVGIVRRIRRIRASKPFIFRQTTARSQRFYPEIFCFLTMVDLPQLVLELGMWLCTSVMASLSTRLTSAKTVA